jgi:hypothetical protein
MVERRFILEANLTARRSTLVRSFTGGYTKGGALEGAIDSVDMSKAKFTRFW